MTTKSALRFGGPLLALALLGLLGVRAEAGHTLTTGTGDASVTVTVDGYGAFGLSVGPNSSDAVYDPVGPTDAAGTTFESGVAIRTAAGTQFLTSGAIGSSGGLTEPTTSGTSTSASSSFSYGGLAFTLTQTVQSLFSGTDQVGSLLTQVYAFTNTSGAPLDFSLIRYIDGDLEFDNQIEDGGGRLISGGTEYLFETDTATGTVDPATFVAITGQGGTVPATGRYEVNSYSDLRDGIIGGSNLADIVAGDGADADQFIDSGNGYDVTLALRNNFSLGVGGTGTYTTQTVFGTGVPQDIPPTNPVPEPGTLVLAGLGALGLLGHAARRRRAAA